MTSQEPRFDIRTKAMYLKNFHSSKYFLVMVKLICFHRFSLIAVKYIFESCLNGTEI